MLENIQRDLNIALMNEVSVIFNKMVGGGRQYFSKKYRKTRKLKRSKYVNKKYRKTRKIKRRKYVNKKYRKTRKLMQRGGTFTKEEDAAHIMFNNYIIRYKNDPESEIKKKYYNSDVLFNIVDVKKYIEENYNTLNLNDYHKYLSIFQRDYKKRSERQENSFNAQLLHNFIIAIQEIIHEKRDENTSFGFTDEPDEPAREEETFEGFGKGGKRRRTRKYKKKFYRR